jgi:hypothetical protein
MLYSICRRNAGCVGISFVFQNVSLFCSDVSESCLFHMPVIFIVQPVAYSMSVTFSMHARYVQ